MTRFIESHGDGLKRFSCDLGTRSEMMSFAAQIIDQQVAGIVAKKEEAFTNELRLGRDDGRKRSAAFLFLVAKTMFDLSDDDTLEGIVDGGEDYGIDALYFEPPHQGVVNISLIQGKYRKRLDRDWAFPENAINGMINAIRILFDPSKEISVN